jgi:hypothetical protein
MTDRQMLTDEQVILTPEQVKAIRLSAALAIGPAVDAIDRQHVLELCDTIDALRERLTCGACDNLVHTPCREMNGEGPLCNHYGWDVTPDRPSCEHWQKEGKGKNE